MTICIIPNTHSKLEKNPCEKLAVAFYLVFFIEIFLFFVNEYASYLFIPIRGSQHVVNNISNINVNPIQERTLSTSTSHPEPPTSHYVPVQLCL